MVKVDAPITEPKVGPPKLSIGNNTTNLTLPSLFYGKAVSILQRQNCACPMENYFGYVQGRSKFHK